MMNKQGGINIKKITLLLLTIILLISGCSQKEIENNSVKVTPSQLFQGDTIRLKPHIDMITGCVDVNYQGNKENIRLKYEIWEEGNLKENKNILSNSIQNNKFSGEISISLKDITMYDMQLSESMKMTTVIRTESGHSSSSASINRFNKEYGHSPQNLQNEINAKEDEEIIIWGLAAGDTLPSGGEDIKNSVKKSKWGLIVKLYFD